MSSAKAESGPPHEQSAASRSEAAAGQSGSTHTARKELKAWEAEERAERAEADLELAHASADQSKAVQAAKQAKDAPAKALSDKKTAVQQSRKALKQAHEAIRRSVEQLNQAVQKIDPEKDDVVKLSQLLAEAEKHMTDISASSGELAGLSSTVHDAEAAAKAAGDDFDLQEPIIQATYEVARLQAQRDYAKAEAAHKLKLAQIKNKFADRIDEL